MIKMLGRYYIPHSQVQALSLQREPERADHHAGGEAGGRGAGAGAASPRRRGPGLHQRPRPPATRGPGQGSQLEYSKLCRIFNIYLK